MPALLKHAWFDLIVALVVVITYFAFLPFVGPMRATAAISIMAVGAVGGVFYRKPKDGAVVTDERDKIIHLQSLAVSWATLWLFLVAFCMITWRLHRGGTVRAEVLPLMLAISWVVVNFSRALATVIMYRRYTA